MINFQTVVCCSFVDLGKTNLSLRSFWIHEISEHLQSLELVAFLKHAQNVRCTVPIWILEVSGSEEEVAAACARDAVQGYVTKSSGRGASCNSRRTPQVPRWGQKWWHHWVCWLLLVSPLFGLYGRLQTRQCSRMLFRSRGTRCWMCEGGSGPLVASCREGIQKLRTPTCSFHKHWSCMHLDWMVCVCDCRRCVLRLKIRSRLRRQAKTKAHSFCWTCSNRKDLLLATLPSCFTGIAACTLQYVLRPCRFWAWSGRFCCTGCRWAVDYEGRATQNAEEQLRLTYDLCMRMSSGREGTHAVVRKDSEVEATGYYILYW